jgi:hypothetical protein
MQFRTLSAAVLVVVSKAWGQQQKPVDNARELRESVTSRRGESNVRPFSSAVLSGWSNSDNRSGLCLQEHNIA